MRLEQVTLPYLNTPAQWATMENGHQIFIIEKPGDVGHLHTIVRVGSVDETEANTGVSHFLEHLMFKGTERFPAGQFDRLLEGMGGRVNASTSRDWTQYFVTFPRDPAGENFRLTLDLHADMLLHAELPEEEIGPAFDPHNPQVMEKRERMVVIEEIKMNRDNPWRNAIQRVNELLYPTHPYQREVIGTEDVIATIPVEDIRAYYRYWYQPSNMITIATGEFPVKATIEEIANAFAFRTIAVAQHAVHLPEIPPGTAQMARMSKPLNVAYVVQGFLGPPSADLRAIVALDVISLLLGEGISSRMQLRLIEQLPETPFFDVGSTHWTFRDSSNILAYGIARPDAADRAVELLHREIINLHNEPPTDEELRSAITRSEAHFAAQAETAAGLSFAIADSMARLNSPDNYTDYLRILHSLTLDDLRNYIATYLLEDRYCQVVVAP